MQRCFFFLLASLSLLTACNNTAETKTTASNTTDSSEQIDGHPAWIQQGNIYEVNVRQYTPEGTFKALPPTCSV
jgi:outer membrane biogenesis lipoprotein LolB